MREKTTRAHRWHVGKHLPILVLALGLGACSSPPPRLFLLNAEQIQPNQHAELSGEQARRDVSAPISRLKAGLSVTVPDYLDRPDILVRSDSNELARLSDARWAEDLSITVSRVMAADLTTALPGADIVPWPIRYERTNNFRLAVDLTKFEADAHGTVQLEGRWMLLDDRSDTTRAGGPFRHAKAAPSADAKDIVQTMSDLLATTSTEIATQLQAQRLASAR
jgi:uncharacterized lipoprotein YmbA